uniref:Regulatory protein zeste n=1 Tax=Globodera rostochiensis TaxID=31243 RepID=A0A914HPS2_GLORO
MSQQINQRLIVVQLARTKKDVLFGQFNPSLTKRMKEQAWESVRQEAIAAGAEGLAKKDWQYVRDSIWQAAQRDAKAKKDKAMKSGEGSVLFNEANYEY